MTVRVRRALIWGATFLLAFASGSLLGRFAVSGLAGGGRPAADVSEAQNFWTAQDEAREAEPVRQRPVEHFVKGIPESHVCEGCDAQLVRSREIGNYLDGEYGPPLGEPGGETLPPGP